VSQYYFIPTNPTHTGLKSNQKLRDKGLENIQLSHSKTPSIFYASVKYMMYAVVFCVCVTKLSFKKNYVFITNR